MLGLPPLPVIRRSAIRPPAAALVAVLVLVMVQIPTRATAQDGASVLQEVQTRYDAISGLEATFSQTVTSPFSPDSTRLEGRLLVQDSMYRIETPEQTLVTDGSTSWIYTPADSQVVVNDAASSEMALSPETFFTDYAAQYEVASITEARTASEAVQVLALTPSSAQAAFESVTLWVRADRVITQLEVKDPGGSTITINLRDIRLNPALARDRFTFEAPPDVEVIDLRTRD